MIDEPDQRLDEGVLRALIPRVHAGLVRRGEDFDAAEDALQEALLEALRVWPQHPPRDPRAWLTTVATRRLVDARRSENARHRREEQTAEEPPAAAPTDAGDDTLFLLFCCCHPALAPASQVALTLRTVGGLTTHEIAEAFSVPEATMAQRISRAKRTLRGQRFDQPGDLAVVLRVLYVIYSTGHAGRVDLAGEAIRLARQLTLATEEPEARGLLALMLLGRARVPARFDAAGRIVTLDRQDRRLWDTREIAEGVRVLQSALALERPGRYQIEAAIAALHCDAPSAEETDWPQILAWYDDLVARSDDPARKDPAAALGRAVAVGHALGPAAGSLETEALRASLGDRYRWHAVRGHLLELAGDLSAAGVAYGEAAHRATNVAERDHLVRQAARTRAGRHTDGAGRAVAATAVGNNEEIEMSNTGFGKPQTAPSDRAAHREPPRILVVMGVSGSGKSTIAKRLAARLGWDFQEGDALHPPENLAKLTAGEPLDDDDRAPWLAAVAAWIEHQTAAGRPGIVTCSALRRRYRDVLRGETVVFVHLAAPTAVIGDRLTHRTGHFMAPSLLGSQVDALEPPTADESAITIDATAPPEEQAQTIIDQLGLLPDGPAGR